MFRRGHTHSVGLLLLLLAARAEAQPFDQVGVRAMGMGGAFVAVADDASAVWWNPAGLASGSFFSLLLEHQARRREPADFLPDLERSAVDQTATGFALATPPLGLSYFRTRYTTIPAAETANGRQFSGGEVSSLIVHQTGVTLLQSITSGFVIGSTLKFVRGIAASGLACPIAPNCGVDVLDEAADLVGHATNRFDADVGVHWRTGPFRLGLTVRNLSEPSFEDVGGQEIVLERQVRAGAAFAVAPSTLLAADVDLTEESEDPAGRRVAFGVEQRWGTRVAIRGGLRLTTGDEIDGLGSVGASFAVRSGLWVDGFWNGAEFDDSRWGVAGRVVF